MGGRNPLLKYAITLCWLAGSAALAQLVDVSGAVTIARKSGPVHGKADRSGVVVWLKSTTNDNRAATHSPARPQFEIRQSHKKFEPHLLPVPVGSVVSFPNLDPFFHNVFSLYDGNRFDLGLYEAGATRSVRFDRPGVSFIFCNIHPEMSAVVVVVDGPYAVSNPAGRVFIPSVAPGRYRLYAWNEIVRRAVESYPMEVEISRESCVLPPISLVDSGELPAPHKNKYGRDYDRLPPTGIYK